MGVWAPPSGSCYRYHLIGNVSGYVSLNCSQFNIISRDLFEPSPLAVSRCSADCPGWGRAASLGGDPPRDEMSRLSYLMRCSGQRRELQRPPHLWQHNVVGDLDDIC
ncbi:hypothetical protein MUK42_30656 [Musa troglodytarum]|uniref:Uncharacterized protein n=1 Tax=Musa troglodytarum TaxID=320322 RepID=A0A9E7FL30_9LILI|nr:hypothetical protein MUK42_30656 [Musa troglodytarum]